MQVSSCRYVDQRAFGGLTALHFAAVTGSLEAAQALLRAGASLLVKTGEGARERGQRRQHMCLAQAQHAQRIAALPGVRACTSSSPLCNHPPPLCAVDGEAYIGDEYLVPGSTPLHVAVMVASAPVAHAILQVRAAAAAAGRGR